MLPLSLFLSLLFLASLVHAAIPNTLQRRDHLSLGLKLFDERILTYEKQLTSLFIDPDPDADADEPVMLAASSLDLSSIFNLRQTPAYLFPFAYVRLLLPFEVNHAYQAQLQFRSAYHRYVDHPFRDELAILEAARHVRPFMIKQLQFVGSQIVALSTVHEDVKAAWQRFLQHVAPIDRDELVAYLRSVYPNGYVTARGYFVTDEYSIDLKPISTASIAQVHRANLDRLIDGGYLRDDTLTYNGRSNVSLVAQAQHVILKIRRPGLAATLQQEREDALSLVNAFMPLMYQANFQQWHKHVAKELDLGQERRNTDLMRRQSSWFNFRVYFPRMYGLLDGAERGAILVEEDAADGDYPAHWNRTSARSWVSWTPVEHALWGFRAYDIARLLENDDKVNVDPNTGLDLPLSEQQHGRLVHGDAHAGNFYLNRRRDRVYVLDCGNALDDGSGVLNRMSDIFAAIIRRKHVHLVNLVFDFTVDVLKNESALKLLTYLDKINTMSSRFTTLFKYKAHVAFIVRELGRFGLNLSASANSFRYVRALEYHLHGLMQANMTLVDRVVIERKMREALQSELGPDKYDIMDDFATLRNLHFADATSNLVSSTINGNATVTLFMPETYEQMARKMTEEDMAAAKARVLWHRKRMTWKRRARFAQKATATAVIGGFMWHRYQQNKEAKKAVETIGAAPLPLTAVERFVPTRVAQWWNSSALKNDTDAWQTVAAQKWQSWRSNLTENALQKELGRQSEEPNE